MRPAAFAIAACALGLAACGSCSKDASSGGGAPSEVSSASSSGAVAEALPRCRGDAQRLVIPGDEVVVGDVAIGPNGLLIGVVRVDGGKRVASVVRAPLDLASSHVIDIGPPLGDDPPPSPRWNGASAYVSFFARSSSDAGGRHRELRIARLDENALGKVEATILQQADESTAFDVAWSESGAGLAAWDEDAPPNLDAGKPLTETYAPEGRGFVKVQPIGAGTRRVASPESSDAESPRLLPRPGGGFWLAWLARRAEDAGYAIESPGEKRAYRWVEVVPLGPTGEPAGPVKRVSPEKGRAVAFELARSGSDLVVMVQDEAALAEGAGARVVRYVVSGENVAGTDVVDGGVGQAIAELVPASSPADASRWLAWTDTSERAHLTPLGSDFVAAGKATSEPALDGARVLAAEPPDALYAVVGMSPSDPAVPPRPEVRRFVCPLGSGEAKAK